MLLLYNIGIKLYFLLIWVASFFNKKAKLWITGRRECTFIRIKESVWFHFASLGEFEQGRPVLEQLRMIHPDIKFVITFFSPSGYEIRKNTPLADYVYYLPLDNSKNATAFIDSINPKFAVFTKYEYWYHFLNEIYTRKIPVYLISAIFRHEQPFFKWYGGLHRKMLSFITRFFVQDERSMLLLHQLGIDHVTVSGDTRFDRVYANACNPKHIPLISEFKGAHQLFIAGSTWPHDEKLLNGIISAFPEWKFIIAPHEISEDRLQHLLTDLQVHKVVCFSGLPTVDDITSPQVLVIDNIGMLASLYQYADIAFIGGGFGAGIHNTLEAAAFGMPVIFGPNYLKFKEACDLVSLEAGFSITGEDTLRGVLTRLATDFSFYQKAQSAALNYVETNTGATKAITGYLARQQ